MDDFANRLPMRPEFAGELCDRRSIQIRADDLPLNVDAVLTSGPEPESLDVDRFVAQGGNARQDLRRAIDADPTCHRDTVANADLSCRPPSLRSEERMPA